MATQGLVTIVKDDEVQMKIITGTDGYNADKLADWLRKNPEAKPQEVYDKALSLSFGSKTSLVVQYAPDKRVADPDMDDLPDLYREKFSEPEFNPRWRHGTADHIVVIDASAPAPKVRRPGP